MLKRLYLRNFTVFADAEFEFGEGINVLVGANGTGKTHVLKAGYAVENAYSSVSPNRQQSLFASDQDVKNDLLLLELFSQFAGVFIPGSMNDFMRRNGSENHRPEQTEVYADFGEKTQSSLAFSITQADSRYKKSLSLLQSPAINSPTEKPVFLPPKELLSLMPGIIGLSDRYDSLFDNTYTNLARLLSVPLLKSSPQYAKSVIARLTHLLGGVLKSDNGRFYLIDSEGERFEVNLIAEGYRKIGVITYLLTNGTLTPETTLFWDEPEANLNPALLKDMAVILADLAQAGFQIILATHSLFLMRELHILAQQRKKPVRYFGLYAGEDGAVQVERQDDLMQLQHLVALDAELAQTFDFEAALDDDYAGDS